MSYSENRRFRKIRDLILQVILGVIIIFFGLLIEYKTGLFKTFINYDIPRILGQTPVPTAITIVEIETVTVSPNNLKSLFDGNLTIAVANISYYSSTDILISSPGYDSTNLANKKVGFKEVYLSNRSYEIQITSIDTQANAVGFTVVAGPYLNNIAQTNIPHITITPNITPTSTPVIFDGIETTTINLHTLVKVFNGDLLISLDSLGIFNDLVYISISSPGYDEKKVEEKIVGYKTTYNSANNYEIQVMAVDPDKLTVTLDIRRFKK